MNSIWRNAIAHSVIYIIELIVVIEISIVVGKIVSAEVATIIEILIVSISTVVAERRVAIPYRIPISFERI